MYTHKHTQEQFSGFVNVVPAILGDLSGNLTNSHHTPTKNPGIDKGLDCSEQQNIKFYNPLFYHSWLQK